MNATDLNNNELSKETIDGPIDEIQILQEPSGLVHIQAENEEDLFFALGFIHGRDRLWQIDFQLRFAEGRVSEVVGEATLEQDILQRTLGLVQAAQSAYENVTPEVEQVLESYTNGLNAYIESATTLPQEFQLLGYEPEPFEPVDVLTAVKLQSLGLSRNFQIELLHSQLIAQGLSFERITEIFPPYEGDVTILQPEDVALIPGLNSEGQSAAEVPRIEEVEQLQSALETIILNQELSENILPTASNNWVVSGERTTTGKPFLANDPHLSLGNPSAWYPVHLSSPTLEVIGATIPGGPVVAIGHNNNIAWGQTSPFADVQDLYVLVETEDGLGYIYQGEFVPYETRQETISVRGGEDRVIQVRESVYGPVISDALGLAQPLALRWVSLDETDGTLEAFLEVNRAQNWEEFTTALESLVAPSLNFVYADREGNIGYFLSGNIPIRQQGHSGLFPVPGTGEFDWEGFIPFDQLPQIYNPERGFIVTANNRIAPSEYPYPISFEWAEPYRAERITELILSEEQLSLDDMKAIQLDQVTLLYRDFVPTLEAIEPLLQSPEAIDWVQRLLQWDGNLSPDSQEATVFETWYNELAKLPARAIGQNVLSDNLLESTPRFLLQALATGDEICGTPEECLAAAAGIFTTVVADFGDSVPVWGEIYQATFPHPVLEQFNLQVPFGGDRYTINVGTYNPETFVQFRGAGYRQIIDFSDLENSQYILPPGTSGDPASPFFSNQLTLWQQGEFLPLQTDLFPIDFKADSAGYIAKTFALNLTRAGGTQVTTQLTNDVLALGTEALFDNLVGLYEVVNANGGIMQEDGTVLLPSDDPSRYAELALTNRADSFQLRAGSSGDTDRNTTAEQFGDVLLEGGQFYAPFVIANGGAVGFDGFINAENAESDGVFNDAADFSDDLVAYFAFSGANPDGAAHLQSRGNNIFGFEDLPSNLGISDNDFNDAIFQFDFSV